MNYFDLKEKNSHGTKDFPIAVYLSHWSITCQWHDEDEIIYVTEGTIKYHLGDNVITLEPGDCAYCKGGSLHSMLLENNQKVSFYALLFDCSYLFVPNDPCCEWINQIKIQTFFSHSNEKDKSIIQIIQRLCQIVSNKEDGYELDTKYELMSFFHTIKKLDMYTFISSKDNMNKKIINGISYIHKHYNERISIQEIASVTGYSASYFEEFFKKYTGKTPFEYLIIYRLERAAALLEQTENSVTDIAISCGMPNISYFIRQFKIMYNTTPLKYRFEHKNKPLSIIE